MLTVYLPDVERVAWTDERLDDLSRRIRDLRLQMRGGFDESHRRIDARGSELRGEIEALRITILRTGGGIMVGLVGVIAAVLVRGA